ncbi:hypothetical protein A3Q56_06805 [Intoshia linei]|uniref:AMP-dependent synthetase/ligase domain-containing protein n=1 Tax=Intoshia linei TaxID=1819745 RepID=A0A177AVA9_9BILA|nr:hypothetical protein A3Q56_06805 [Intoshia linei]
MDYLKRCKLIEQLDANIHEKNKNVALRFTNGNFNTYDLSYSELSVKINELKLLLKEKLECDENKLGIMVFADDEICLPMCILSLIYLQIPYYYVDKPNIKFSFSVCMKLDIKFYLLNEIHSKIFERQLFLFGINIVEKYQLTSFKLYNLIIYKLDFNNVNLVVEKDFSLKEIENDSKSIMFHVTTSEDNLERLFVRKYQVAENAPSPRLPIASKNLKSLSMSTLDDKIINVKIDEVELYKLTVDDELIMICPMTFDASIVQVLVMLIVGGRINYIERDKFLEYKFLYETIFEKCYTTIFQISPSLLKNLIDYFNENVKCEEKQYMIPENGIIRNIGIGGEKFPSCDLMKGVIHPNNQCCQFFNLYGLTEVSAWASSKKIIDIRNYEKVDLGDLFYETKFCLEEQNDNCYKLIIDSERKCYINGKRAPSLFDTGDIVQRDGDKIYFVSRDNQLIKIHTKKFNLNQIEETIHNILNIHNVVVFHNQTIVAFIETCEQVINTNVLNNNMKFYLPDYMIPKKYIFLDKFPLNNNGNNIYYY